jgi:hypothetical protein
MEHQPIDERSLEDLAQRADGADVEALVAECRRLRQRLERAESDVLSSARAERRALAASEALELDVERVHRLLDSMGLPRERSGEGQPQELSLLGRLQEAFEEQD